MFRMCAKRHKHVFIEDISWETKRSSFCVSEEEKGTVEIKRTHSFHFISLSFSFSFSLPLSLSCSVSLSRSLLIHMHTHAQRYPLSQRSEERALENRRSWLAGEKQEPCCVNKASKKVCSPGEKSSCEMPGNRDLKVGVHGTQAAESRRK